MKVFALLTGHGARPDRLPPELRQLLRDPARSTAARPVYLKDFTAEGVELVWELHRSGLEPLRAAGKLGALLFQFAPWFTPSRDARAYLSELPRRLPGETLAVEFRGGGWMDADSAGRTLALLERHGLAYVSVDEPQGFPNSTPPLAAATADLAYVRFHGRNSSTWRARTAAASDRFNYLYSDAELRDWVPRIRELAERSTQSPRALQQQLRGRGGPQRPPDGDDATGRVGACEASGRRSRTATRSSRGPPAPTRDRTPARHRAGIIAACLSPTWTEHLDREGGMSHFGMNDHDWNGLEAETVGLLSALLRTDTSNPPGNETACALVLRDYLADSGVAVRPGGAVPGTAEPGRPRCAVTGPGPTLLLLGHTDVVPAEADEWSEPPFSGAVKDGYVWGRGALDMKCQVAAEAVAVARAARSGARFARRAGAGRHRRRGARRLLRRPLAHREPAGPGALRLRAQRGRRHVGPRQGPPPVHLHRRREGLRRLPHPHAGPRRPRVRAAARAQRGRAARPGDHPAGRARPARRRHAPHGRLRRGARRRRRPGPPSQGPGPGAGRRQRDARRRRRARPPHRAAAGHHVLAHDGPRRRRGDQRDPVAGGAAGGLPHPARPPARRGGARGPRRAGAARRRLASSSGATSRSATSPLTTRRWPPASRASSRRWCPTPTSCRRICAASPTRAGSAKACRAWWRTASARSWPRTRPPWAAASTPRTSACATDDLPFQALFYERLVADLLA